MLGRGERGGVHNGTYLATRGTEGAIGGDGDCVDVAGVAHQIAPELAVGQVPHLQHMHHWINNCPPESIACKPG